MAKHERLLAGKQLTQENKVVASSGQNTTKLEQLGTAIPETNLIANCRFAKYCQVRSEFQSTPEVSLLQHSIGDLDQRINTVSASGELALSLIAGSESKLTEARKKLHSETDRTNSLAQKGNLGVTAGNLLYAAGLDRLAAKVHPVTIAKSKEDKVRDELEQIRREKSILENKLREKQGGLESQKQETSLQLRKITETWVLEDRDRVFAYAVENQSRAAVIFGQFAKASFNPAETLKSLVAEYYRFTKVILNINPAREAMSNANNGHAGSNKTLRVVDKPTVTTDGNGVTTKDTRQKVIETKEKETVPEQEKKLYPVGVLHKSEDLNLGHIVEPLTEEKLEDYIAKKADKLASNDQTLLADLQKIINSLRESPFAQSMGVKKFVNNTVAVNGLTYHIMSFDPKKRIGLKLEHKGEKGRSGMYLRVTYVIYEDEKGEKVLAIEGIYTHSQYDRKYTVRQTGWRSA